MKLLQYAHIWKTLSDEQKNEVRRIKVWVVVAFDLATRYILGMRFCESPNTQATIDVIRMAMSDKRGTSKYVGAISEWIGRARPEVIYTDNGSALVNDAVAEVLVDCEIGHTRPAAEHPQARGHIESSFRTHRRVVRHFQGRTFKDILEKSKDYNAVRTASLPIDEFEKEYVRALLDVYHNTPHEGLGGETPHNAWVRLTQKYKMRPLIGKDVMRNIFGMEYTRILDGGGLVFMGIPYHSPVLAAWLKDRGKVEVTIHIDVDDLSSISFLKDGGWTIADNQIDLAPGIALAEWMEVWNRVGGEFKESSEVTMDILLTGLLTLRESGESAALQNPLGLRNLSKDKVMALDRRLLHRGHRLKPAVTEIEVPAPVYVQGAFIGENSIGYDEPVSELAAQAEQLEAAKKAATNPKPKTRRGGSDQLGSTDNIKF